MQLILGGARSGKSRLAEARALVWAQAQPERRLVYVATATAGDGEMLERIAHHQARRGDQWQLVESPQQLAETLIRYQGKDTCILVDCLTLWLSNCLHLGSWEQEREQLLQLVQGATLGELIFVSNEVGSGVVPLGELSRQFVDASGHLHQALAGYCDRVTLTVAGLPLELKPVELKSVELKQEQT